jgi:predicted GNAT family N-acyltransferase
MIPAEFHVEPATWSVDMAALRAIRTEVFVTEQNVPEDEEWDEFDAISQHVIARTPDGTAIGTGRLTPHGTLGRMAVMRDWRGKGVGQAMLRVLLEMARDRHFSQVRIHAQLHALAFYERAGFVAHGEEFEECGIPHRHMDIAIPPLPARAQKKAEAQDAALLESEDLGSARAAMLAVIANARRELNVYERDLDADFFDDAEILEALKQVAITEEQVQIRILVLDPQRARANAHRLVALAHRLSSVFAFRTPVELIDRQYAGSFIVADRGAWFERPLASRFDGEGSRYGPGRRAQLHDRFCAIWERSEDCAEMRRLEI